MKKDMKKDTKKDRRRTKEGHKEGQKYDTKRNRRTEYEEGKKKDGRRTRSGIEEGQKRAMYGWIGNLKEVSFQLRIERSAGQGMRQRRQCNLRLSLG